MTADEYSMIFFIILVGACHLLNHLYHSTLKTYYFSVSIDDIMKNNGVLKHTWYTDIEIFAKDFGTADIKWDACVIAKQRSSLYVYKHYEMRIVPINLSDYDDGGISYFKYRNEEFKILNKNGEWENIPEYYVYDFKQFFANARTFKSE